DRLVLRIHYRQFGLSGGPVGVVAGALGRPIATWCDGQGTGVTGSVIVLAVFIGCGSMPILRSHSAAVSPQCSSGLFTGRIPNPWPPTAYRCSSAGTLASFSAR